MTAHVLYEAIDGEHCATLSRTIIEDVIRGEIGFDGLLFSDDLKMKALGGSLEARIRDSLAAGGDVALCCNFTMDEKQEALKGAGELSGKSATRAAAALDELQAVERGDTVEAYSRLQAMLAPVLG